VDIIIFALRGGAFVRTDVKFNRDSKLGISYEKYWQQ
jgi:hypothetical protein